MLATSDCMQGSLTRKHMNRPTVGRQLRGSTLTLSSTWHCCPPQRTAVHPEQLLLVRSAEWPAVHIASKPFPRATRPPCGVAHGTLGYGHQAHTTFLHQRVSVVTERLSEHLQSKPLRCSSLQQWGAVVHGVRRHVTQASWHKITSASRCKHDCQTLQQ
jgi:hypothetical protein